MKPVFITLTLKDLYQRLTRIKINVNAIKYYYPGDEGTTVAFHDDSYRTVIETPERIEELINEA